MSDMAKKIKIYCFVKASFGEDVQAKAICECGKDLGGHVSSNVHFAKADMGVTQKTGIGGKKHEIYREHAGKGNYELAWVSEHDSEFEAVLNNHLETRGKGKGHEKGKENDVNG
jgi:hypothetical protein